MDVAGQHPGIREVRLDQEPGEQVMRTQPWTGILSVSCALAGAIFWALPSACCAEEKGGDERASKPDSYLYYGPNGLWRSWHDPANPNAAAQRLGRDTWIHWTWGNQKFLRKASVLAGRLSVPVSLDFFRLLDSRRRATRFRDFGLINEPNCEENAQPDEFGLYLDRWKGDPLGYYPTGARGALTYPGSQVPVDTRHYGRPAGVVGLRLFPNPQFDSKAWDIQEYFRNPGRVEPPYLVGFSCAFCHMAFDPVNPPADPEHPRWENLAANLGNQYFREGELMLGKGRVLFGDKHPDPASPRDPYRTAGLTEEDFLYQYASTQQPGTSETSRISYDFINNPNTINPIFNLRHRPQVQETAPNGAKRQAMHILKDGADSVGIQWALMRVPINIGCEGEYWIDHLFNPASGRRQKPFRIEEVLSGLPEKERAQLERDEGLTFKDVSPERLAELRLKYRSAYGKEEFGQDWQEAWHRHGTLAAYLQSYGPAHLEEAVKAGVAPRSVLPDEQARLRGARLFGEHCARCHSSKQPGAELKTEQQRREFFIRSAQAQDFRDGNFLSDDARYPVTEIGTNMARALATNAVDGDIWAEFSSREYKALPPLGRLTLDVPVFPEKAVLPASVKRPIRVEFVPPGGGRGYYRTPTLISMWATAPYFHNNALGDYYVMREDGTKGFFANDGQRIGRWLPDGTWVDYRLDVSVEGRLRMFEDGVDKLLNPARRHRWVKRTSAASTLIPDLEHAVGQFALEVVRGIAREELVSWLREQQVPPDLAQEAVEAVTGVFEKAVSAVLPDSRVSLRFGWAAVQMRLRDHADRVFDLAYDDLKNVLAGKFPNRKLPLDELKPALRQAFLSRLDALDKRLSEAAVLRIPARTPVNLYANLNASALVHAALAHLRYRHEPRALAEALLELSDCPDLVEDGGHLYGTDLNDQEKKDLIAFLKTL
jgi:hypothetical protein